MATSYRAHLRRGLEEYDVPVALHTGLIEYFAARRQTGSFLRACLENDFTQACARADVLNRFALYEIAMFLFSFAPAPAWGSPEKVAAWLADPAPVPDGFE